MESRRQKKVASLIQKELSEIFTKEGSSFYGQAFVTISDVSVTPDLLVARVHVSIFKNEKASEIVAGLNHKVSEIRKKLGFRIRHQVRKIPELEFFLDDSLDKVYRMEDIFKNL